MANVMERKMVMKKICHAQYGRKNMKGSLFSQFQKSMEINAITASTAHHLWWGECHISFDSRRNMKISSKIRAIMAGMASP